MKKVFLIALLIAMSLIVMMPIAGHAFADSFDENDIIDDSVFDDTSTMNASQINSWLNSNFPKSCISTNNGFSAPDPTGYSPSGGYTYGANVSAGQVVYDSALAYGLNPQVILATLEKESSVVSGNASYGCEYINTAMGYACPDSGSCPTDPATESGFSKQVIHASWLLRFGEQRSQGNTAWDVQQINYPESGDSWDNSDDPQSCYSGPMTQGTYQICPESSSTYYDGYTTIDGTSVHMDDGATAALYNYTPHFPGNENFWTIFNNWFGATTGNSNSNTLNFIRLNYYSGNVQLIGYPSVGSYSYTNRNTTVPYPDDPTVYPLFRPNGDLSFVSLNDPSGKVKVTTFSAASNFQQLSSVIYVPYPAQAADGSVIPLFRPNGDISFVRLNYYTGHTQVVTYSFGSYFQQVSSNIVTGYPDVSTNGSVVPLFRPNGDLSFVNLSYYAGHTQVVTYSFGSYFQQVSSNIITAYPTVPTNGSVVPMFQPDEDLSFVNMNYYTGRTQVVTYSYGYYYQLISEQDMTGYPTITDYANVKPLISTAF